MNIQENRNKWLTALKSNKYRQAFGSMVGPKPNCYCALGVGLKELGYFNNRKEYAGLNGRTWLSNQMGISSLTASTVVAMNDGMHSSFNEIANYLEKLFDGIRPSGGHNKIQAENKESNGNIG